MSQDTLIIVVVVAIVALVVGFFVGKSTGKNNSSEVDSAQRELAEYKEAVSEHFGKTADLIDNLTSSYKDVFEHLGASAQDLLDEKQVKKHIESRAQKSVTLTYTPDEVLDNAGNSANENSQEQRDAHVVIGAESTSDENNGNNENKA